MINKIYNHLKALREKLKSYYSRSDQPNTDDIVFVKYGMHKKEFERLEALRQKVGKEKVIDLLNCMIVLLKIQA